MAPLVIDVSSSDDPRDVVHRAVQALVEGKLVAFPTETVYVAAAAGLNANAVDRLVALRGRQLEGPATLVIRGTEEALDYAPQLPSLGLRLARRCWPGPITLEVEDAQPDSVVQRLPANVRQVVAPKKNIRLRVPAHELITGVSRLIAGPLVVLGARRNDQGNALSGSDVVQQLGSDVDVILDDGKCKFGQQSSIVRVADNSLQLVRPGVVSETHLKRLASFMVVLVCTGNTCRSPMAEVMLKKRLADKLGCPIDQLEDRGFLVMSAGLSAAPGGRSAAEAQSVMRERGLDLSMHESQPLGERIIRFADVIITMTRAHRDAIVSQIPEAAPRTFVLSRNRGDVSDPIGGPIEQYRRCAEQIDAYLESWADEIAEAATGDKHS
jgi:tRNA threonylcarbamoyl adenosine modification protein (Sua5/YciO/YrdC/YwlC family)